MDIFTKNNKFQKENKKGRRTVSKPRCTSIMKPFTDTGQIPVLLCVEDMCRLFQKNDFTIRKLCREGTLPARKVGGEWYIGKKDALALAGLSD